MKILIITIWAALVIAGLVALTAYKQRPGNQAAAPAVWPRDTAVTFAPGDYNLVLSVHPNCPCTTATIEELSQIVTQAPKIRVQVLVYKPKDSAADWIETSTVHRLREFPNTSLITDVDGMQAELFGALTSGDVQLYAPDKSLAFHGGITSSRGHVGDNAGVDAIVQLARGGETQLKQTAVFGCAIHERECKKDGGK